MIARQSEIRARVPGDLHRKVRVFAAEAGVSVSRWVRDTLAFATAGTPGDRTTPERGAALAPHVHTSTSEESCHD